METILHHYYYNLENPEEKQKWEALKTKLQNLKYKCFEAIPTNEKSNDVIRIESFETVCIDPQFLFNNQWNEAHSNNGKNRRLFDWYLRVFPNKKIKSGHWLEITDEMKAIRENTYQCGYCGKYSHKDNVFCTQCLGSEYLKKENLPLLRFQAISDTKNRPELSKTEAAKLIPLWEKAQGLGRLKREEQQAAKRRQKIASLVADAKAKGKKLLEEAKIETKAFTWLLNHKFREIENVIYYSHKNEFCFGWRNSIPEKERENLSNLLKSFPFKWTVK